MCGLTTRTPGPPPAPQSWPGWAPAAGWSLLVPHTVGLGTARALRAALSLTREGGGPQGYFDGRQRQEVAGMLAGGGWAPTSLGVHGDHGCGGSGSGGGNGDGRAAADGLKAVVATTCRRGTRGSAWGHLGPQETPGAHGANPLPWTRRPRAALPEISVVSFPNVEGAQSARPRVTVSEDRTPKLPLPPDQPPQRGTQHPAQLPVRAQAPHTDSSWDFGALLEEFGSLPVSLLFL